MKQEKCSPEQLSLFDEMGNSSFGAVTSTPPPVRESVTPSQEPQPIAEKKPRQRAMTVKEMCEIRSWLFEWGKGHGYPAFSFAIGDGVMGDHRTGAMRSGEAHWTNALRCQDMEWAIKAVEWIKAGKVQP